MLLFTIPNRKTLNQIAEHSISADSTGKELKGDNTYTLHLPPGIPASDFWSVIVYDSQTRLMIHAGQPWPSVHRNCKKLMFNPEGSLDIWFGPEPLPGKENNWVQTIRGKRWYLILRLYDPLESWFNVTWKPGDIEEVK